MWSVTEKALFTDDDIGFSVILGTPIGQQSLINPDEMQYTPATMMNHLPGLKLKTQVNGHHSHTKQNLQEMNTTQNILNILCLAEQQ